MTPTWTAVASALVFLAVALPSSLASDVAVTRQVIDGELEDIQWFGKDQKTVLILTDAHTLYRSADGGKTFTSQSNKLQGAGRGGSGLRVRSIVRPSGSSPGSKVDYSFYMLLLGQDGQHWTSKDGGKSYEAIKSSVAFTEAKLHEDMILATSTSAGCSVSDTGASASKARGRGCYKTLHASYDFGATWKECLDYVVQFDWARNLVDVYDGKGKMRHAHTHSTELAKAHMATGKEVRVEEVPRQRIFATKFKTEKGDQQFGIWSPDIHMLHSDDAFKTRKVLLEHGNRFVFMGRYIFVAEFKPHTPNRRRHKSSSVSSSPHSGPSVLLRVSADIGRTFSVSKLPLKLRQHEFTILDTSEQSVFLHVNHEGANANYGNVYSSDATGSFYSMTLRKNRRDDGDGKCDFEKIEGLMGVYMANIVAHPEDVEVAGADEDDNANNDMGEDDSAKFERKRSRKETGDEELIKSVVTFDKGGEWAYLNPPERDATGKAVSCNHEDGCSLHLHGTTDLWGPMYSSANALGLVMATGNIGPGLTPHEDQTNTYLTRDGGLSWFEVMKGSHIYEFGDHGGLILMAKDQEATDELLYSHDEGVTWKKFRFSDRKMEVNNIIIERTTAAQQFLVYGTEKEKESGKHVGVVYFVDFEGLHTRQCVGIDQPDTEDSDYELWSPWDGRYGGKCLLGHMIQYTRRKRDKKCFNGLDHERAKFIKSCPCVAKDFECDFGYERPMSDKNGPCTAVATLSKAKASMDEDGARVAETDAASPTFSPPVCSSTGFYKITKGYRRVAGDICLEDAEGATKLSPQIIHCSGGHMGLVFFILAVVLLGCGGAATVMKSKDMSAGEAFSTVMVSVVAVVCAVVAFPFKLCSACKRGEGGKRSTGKASTGFGSEDLHSGFSSFTDEPTEAEVRGGDDTILLIENRVFSRKRRERGGACRYSWIVSC